MKRRGFTLLELLVVVVVIGVLASLAVPRFVKTIETARIAEAQNWLGAIRNAEFRYRLRETAYTSDLSKLDIDDANNEVPRYYNYRVKVGVPEPTILAANCAAPGSAAEPFWIVATRITTANRPSPPPGIPIYEVKLSNTGNLCDGLP